MEGLSLVFLFLRPLSWSRKPWTKRSLWTQEESLRGSSAPSTWRQSLKTGRSKDKARLLQFLESGVLNAQKFGELVTRHGLSVVWTRFGQQFLSDEP